MKSKLITAALVALSLAVTATASAQQAQTAPAPTAPGGPGGQAGWGGEGGHFGRRGFGRGFGPGAEEHFGEHRLEMLTAVLGLDANQQQLVRQALDQARTEMMAARQQPGFEPHSPAAMQAREQIRTRTEQRIDDLLTPAQRQTFDRVRALRERMRTQWMQNHPEGFGGGPRGGFRGGPGHEGGHEGCEGHR